MSNYENPHDDDSPRFEPWLATIASSFLPVAAAFYLPKAFSALLLTATVVLFAAGLIMLKVQSARRARERNRTLSAPGPLAESFERKPIATEGATRSLAPIPQLHTEDR